MKLSTAKLITRIIVIGTPLVWIGWDLFAFLSFGVEATESHLFWTTYLAWHPFALLLGLALVVLLWHFFAE